MENRQILMRIRKNWQNRKQMTVERGASVVSEGYETARNMIVKLQAKQNISNENML